MIFEQLNPNYCRTYLMVKDGDEHLVMVDPSLEHMNVYLELLKKRNLKLTHVIDTHTHADHISAGAALKDITGCEYVMHENSPAKCVSIRVKDGDIMTINGIEFRFIHTPGHTKDSMSILLDDIIMTGDFLFLDDAGGGRDDLPGGDVDEHWESLKKLETLSDSLVVYPAHEYGGREPSTLGKQRISNPHLQMRSRAEFSRYIGSIGMGPAEWMKDVIKANQNCATDRSAAYIPEDTKACQIVRTVDKSVHDIEVKFISAPELNEMLASQPEDVALLDVREKYELTDQLGHIKGIIHIPIGTLAQRLDELEQYRDKIIIVICRSGVRSATGAQILSKAGFEKVLVLQGGMIAWKKGNFPVE
jgi:sulfur dioxygenase